MSSLSSARRIALFAGAALALHANPALAQDVTVTNSGNVTSYTIPAPQDPDTFTLINNGRIGTGSTSSTGNLAISSTTGDGQVVIQNNSLIRGRIDLSDISGGVDLDIAPDALWRFSGDSTFGAGSDTLSVQAGGGILMGNSSAQLTTIDFGAGDNSFSNAGTIVFGPKTNAADVRNTIRAELRLQNLTTFENSGLVVLGGYNSDVGSSTGYFDNGSDLWADDILAMDGAAFIGSGDSRIIMDVDLNGGSQSACDAGQRDDDGDLAADCLSIVGGSTAGSTLLTINDVFSGARGAYVPAGIVLIDVSGGTSAAEHFTIDPNSTNYSPAFGGSIDKGLFVFPLVYDEATQQHKLVSLAAAPAYEQPMIAQAANALWRLGAAGFFQRQADLRDTVGEAGGGGIWLRGAAGSVERETSRSVMAAGRDFGFDIDADQDSFAVTGGMDLISTDNGASSFVLGLTGGYASSEIEFSGSGDTAQFDGLLGGVYASLVMADFFADAIVSGAKMDMKNDIPALNLFPSGTILRTDLRSVGARIETGYRFGVGEGFSIEPLAGLSYVTTSFDDVDVPAGDPASDGNTVAFDDLESLRASLGLRASLDSQFDPVRVHYSLTGRVVQEFQGEASTAILNPGEDAIVGDDLSGTFGEIVGSVGLFSADGSLSGFVNGGAEFGDGYTGASLSAGIRYRF